MAKLFAKFAHLILIAAFVFQYGEVYLLLKNSSTAQSSVRAGCGCDMRVCCCSGTANMADDMCGITGRTAGTKEARDVTHPVYASCGSAEKTVVISAFKQVLPFFSNEILFHHPSFFRYCLQTTFLKPLELEHSIFRPPRA